jgi:hypothetical protein
MMNINIYMVKVQSISNIGSLNIGKTILCKNQAAEISQGNGSEPAEPAVGVSPVAPVVSPVPPVS